MTVLNPSPAAEVSDALLDVTSVLVLNEHELSVLSGRSVTGDSSVEDIRLAAKPMLSRRTQVVVTLGSRDVVGLNGDEHTFVEGRSVETVDTTGAGDCFTGSLAAQLADGASLDAAMEYANCAASLCVQKAGAAPSMPAAAEVAAQL